ncbi:MAG: hypothetical protein JWO63_1590 [Frankiales bacterium]|nr:hypothetical protein [Frankiales bacterium]
MVTLLTGPRPRTGGVTRIGPRAGPVALAVAGVAVLLPLGLPVADLQAAHARAQAFGNGARQYWFSWFGGEVPGRYSVLTPAITSWLGSSVVCGASVIVIGALAGPLLRTTPRPGLASYALVLAALANCASGRVAFCFGSAVALAGVLLLLRGRPWSGGLLNGLAALASGLPTAFVLLTVLALGITDEAKRGSLLRFAAPSVLGLLAGPAVFGAPGPMAFDSGTLLKLLVIGLALAALARPGFVRVNAVLAVLVSVLLYFVPNGIGANIDRYVVYALTPLALAFAARRRTVVVLAVLPALVYAGAQLEREITAARAPSARAEYYVPLERYLQSQPNLAQHRVEVLDTPTHRASAELSRFAYLARGWESQTDRADNPLFYAAGALTDTTYQRWLTQLAVGWVAVPDDLNSVNRSEAALIAGGLPYLAPVSRQRHWTVYRVLAANPLVAAPARVLSAGPADLLITVPTATEVVIRVRPSPYLRASANGGTARISARDATSIRLQVSQPGTYRLSGAFTGSALLRQVGRWLP